MGEQNPTTSELIEELQTFTELSEREAEVVVHMADELEQSPNASHARKQVASGLGIEPSTVDTYYRRALEKFERAVKLREEATSHLAAVFHGAGKQLVDDRDVEKMDIECGRCGSTNIEHEDMGEHGFALVCNECDATLQAG